MKQDISSSDSTSCASPKAFDRRFREIKNRLAIQIKKILDDDKIEGEENQKQCNKKSKIYTNLQQIQHMKDAKSQNGFQHEYQLVKKLGEGCHSSVYKCRCKKENKIYAVKILKQKDMEIIQNIRQSYRILKKLQHQNIVQTKNLFINQKYFTCHLVLEFCQWHNLQTFIINTYQFTKQQIAGIISELLKTIAFMHNLGICHRDIKPDNILYNQKKKSIKIVDFQIARMKKYTNQKLQMMTKTGIISYRAPEIFHSVYDEKVDVWAVGVITYLLLKKCLPFVAEYEDELIKNIMNQEPNYDGFSVWQIQFLQRVLCKDPSKRSTAAEALSSPFLFINSLKVSNPCYQKPNGIIRSPSLGNEQFEQSLLKQKNISSKFYDDDLTNMFLGNNQGDIGVIRWEENNSDHSDEDFYEDK